MRTKLRQVDNGIGRACAFFLETSLEDFLVIGSLPASAGSTGSISFMGRFQVRQSIRAPRPQLLAPPPPLPGPASRCWPCPLVPREPETTVHGPPRPTQGPNRHVLYGAFKPAGSVMEETGAGPGRLPATGDRRGVSPDLDQRLAVHVE